MILTAAAAPCLSAQSRLRVLQVTGAVGWRKDSIKYKKNEVFLDIVEQVNMLTSSKGNVLRCDVNGKIVMKVFLSGMPDVKLGLEKTAGHQVRALEAAPMELPKDSQTKDEAGKD